MNAKGYGAEQSIEKYAVGRLAQCESGILRTKAHTEYTNTSGEMNVTTVITHACPRVNWTKSDEIPREAMTQIQAGNQAAESQAAIMLPNGTDLLLGDACCIFAA